MVGVYRIDQIEDTKDGMPTLVSSIFLIYFTYLEGDAYLFICHWQVIGEALVRFMHQKKPLHERTNSQLPILRMQHASMTTLVSTVTINTEKEKKAGPLNTF